MPNSASSMPIFGVRLYFSRSFEVTGNVWRGGSCGTGCLLPAGFQSSRHKGTSLHFDLPAVMSKMLGGLQPTFPLRARSILQRKQTNGRRTIICEGLIGRARKHLSDALPWCRWDSPRKACGWKLVSSHADRAEGTR